MGLFEGIIKNFLYYPTKLSPDASPPAYAGDAEQVWIASADGERIHGLYWSAPAERPTVLFFHGNAQSVFEWALVQQELAPLECGLLLIDYPGYGKSSGSPSEAGLFAAGRASLSWLADQQNTPASDVILFGKSLGGPVAVEVAQQVTVKGVVLESTFRSFPSAVSRVIPLLPADSLIQTERFEVISKVATIGAPLLVIHGTTDQLIPCEEGRQLYERAAEPKQLYLVEGAGHNDVSLVAQSEYAARLRRWLDEVSSDG